MIWLFSFFMFLLLPDSLYAWGPLTHAYLAEQIFSIPFLVSTGTLTMIKIFKEYFIYGNLIPDTVIGKKYLPDDKNPHTWKTGLVLLNEAKTPDEKSFAYGYLTHLAADVVLHNDIKNLTNFQHVIFEFKADRIIDKQYWFKIMLIDKSVRKRSEKFFERAIMQTSFSLKTSKKIYRSFLFLSAFNSGELKNIQIFESLHLSSLSAMIDVLNGQGRSSLVKLYPGF